ncbi:MAG: hypothetical protein ACPGC9_01645 [Cytophagales bacterium]
MEKKEIKYYSLAALFMLATTVAGLGYYYYSHQKEEQASQKLSLLNQEATKTEEEEAQKHLARRYLNLYRTYPNTKAGRTACFRAGGIYYGLKHYKKVIETLQGCPPFTEQTTAVFECQRQKMLGEAYRDQKEYEQAIACYTKATAGDWGMQGVYLEELAETYRALYEEQKKIKYLQEGIKALKKACATYPSHERFGKWMKKKEQFARKLKHISNKG